MQSFHDPPRPVPSSQDTFATAMFIRNCISYVAITVHVCEWIRFLPLEIKYIWRKPSSSIVKWQYLFSLYGAMLAQIVNTVFSAQLRSSHPMPITFCRSVVSSQLVTGQTLLLSLHVSSIHRVFALYNCSASTVTFLSLFVILEYVGSITLGVQIVEKLEIHGPCFTNTSPRITFTMVLHMATQCIAWLLILLKSAWRTKAPIITRVLRDGSLAFGTMLVPFICFIFNTFHPVIRLHKTHVFQAMFSISILIMSSINCRIIMNMETMAPTIRDESFSIELTTIDTSQEFETTPRVTSCERGASQQFSE